MHVQESHARPRNLRWFLAGPLLYGDLGTSRLYVLGLAIYFAGKSAPFYVGAVGLVLIAVAWAYTIICRTHPDGGGVYSSAREVHPTLGLIGATLLFTDYIVTAAISTFDAIKYIGVPLHIPLAWEAPLSVLVIGLLGVLNFVGPRRAGTFALTIAVASIAATLMLAGFAVPQIGAGYSQITQPPGNPAHWWSSFVDVVLALSGIEAISNMTGIMAQPVRRTTKLSIWPVILEVVAFNVVLIIATCSLPGLTLPDGAPFATLGEHALSADQLEIRDRIISVVSLAFVGPHFAAVASILFGLLLISATNTAILGMVNIQYSMSRDGELPAWFARLNQYGVPWWGLYAACLLPAAIIVIAQSIETLAGMYAIGVVGAICINLACTAWNRKLEIRPWERSAMWALGAVMLAIWVTIAFTKLAATTFLIIVLVGGGTLRLVAKRFVRPPVPAAQPLPAAQPIALAPVAPFDPSRPRILVATRGNTGLVKFAVRQAKQNNANLFVLFVRELAVMFPGQAPALSAAEDADATNVFRESERMAIEAGVPLQMIYATSDAPAEVILDSAGTYAADQVILGISRRAAVMRALRGDVIETVAANLPEESTLLIHA